MRTRPALRTPRRALALAALLLFQPLSQGALPPFYTVTPVVGPYGPMSGVALNDMGVVLGGYPDWAFLWSGSGISPILQSGAFSAYGMNIHSTVVGQARVMFDDGTKLVPARWDSGALTVLSSKDAAGRQTTGIAYGINQQGWTVGIHAVDGGPGTPSAYQGTLWSPTNQAQSLGAWTPVAINNQNMVVGGNTIAGVGAPALWTAADGMRELPLPAGASGSAHGINALGQVIGSYTNGGGQGGGGGFLWSAASGFQALAAPQGSFASGAAAINDWGQTVGHHSFYDYSLGPLNNALNTRYGAVLWDAGSSAPVDLESLARMPGGGTLADAGLWLTQATDINARGQILVIGSRLIPVAYSSTNEMTLTNFEAYVLSPCLRCGQILPNPNPAGATLDVGPDWVDAYNVLDYVNQGRLWVRTELRNKAGAVIDNVNQVAVGDGLAGRFLNEGKLVNRAGAVLTIDGYFSNRHGTQHGAAEVRNAGAIWINEQALVINSGFWEQESGLTVLTGGSFNNSSWFAFKGGEFRQTGGSFVNQIDADVYVRGALVDVMHVENHGRMQLGRIEAFGPTTVVRVDGLLSNGGVSGGAFEDAQLSTAHADVTIGTGAFANHSGRALLEAGSRWRLERNALLNLRGGVMTLRSGAEVVLASDSDGLEMTGSARLLLEAGSRLQSDARVRTSGTADVQVAGTLALGSGWEHGGRLTVQSGGRLDGGGGSGPIDLSGPGTLSGLVNLGGVVQVQQGGEVRGLGSFAQTAGTTTVDGLLQAGHVTMEGGLLDVSILGRVESQSFVQVAGTSHVNGVLQAPQMRFESGELSGSGVLRGNVIVIRDGLQPGPRLRIGNSPGILTIDGDLSLHGAEMELEVADYRSFDRLVVTGTADIGSLNVTFTPGSGYQPDLNDSFQWLQAGQGITGLEYVVFDNVPDGWHLLSDAPGRIGLWNTDAEELPEGGVSSFEVDTGRLAYLSPQRAGTGYEVASNLWVSGALAVQPQAVMNVRGALSVEVGGRLSNRGQIEAFEGLRNQGRFENRDDGVLLLPGSAGLRNEGVLVNSGRLTSAGQVVNLAGARLDNAGAMTAPWLRNEGHVIVSGSLVLTEGVNNFGRFEVASGGRVDVGADYLQIDSGADTPVTRVDGVLLATSGYISIAEGILEGSGHIQDTLLLGGNVSGGPIALVRPGGRDAIGTLTVDVLQVGRANFEVDIASAQRFDQLVSLGIYMGDGEVRFRLLDGFLPMAGSSFSWLGDTPSLTLAGPDALRWSVSLVRADHSEWLLAGSAGADPAAPLRFSFDGVQLHVTAVPEPGTTAMWLLGLIVVAGCQASRSVRRGGAAG